MPLHCCLRPYKKGIWIPAFAGIDMSYRLTKGDEKQPPHSPLVKGESKEGYFRVNDNTHTKPGRTKKKISYRGIIVDCICSFQKKYPTFSRLGQLLQEV